MRGPRAAAPGQEGQGVAGAQSGPVEAQGGISPDLLDLPHRPASHRSPVSAALAASPAFRQSGLGRERRARLRFGCTRPIRRSMRVLMLNYEYPPLGGGTGLACQHLLEALSGRPGLEIDLVTSGRGAAPETERLGSRVTIRRLPVGKRDDRYWRAPELARWTWRASRLARRLAREHSYGCATCGRAGRPGFRPTCSRGGSPTWSRCAGPTCPATTRGCGCWTHCCSAISPPRSGGGRAAVVSVSSELRNLAHRDAPWSFHRCHPERHRYAALPGRQRSRPRARCSSSAAWCPARASVSCWRPFASCRPRKPPSSLWIAGDGPERPALEALARRSGCAERIHFLGHVEHGQLPELFRRASVFVLPSLHEGMPNALLEAMGVGPAARLHCGCFPRV